MKFQKALGTILGNLSTDFNLKLKYQEILKDLKWIIYTKFVLII